MSDSVRPHPWDSPGKNTGVGCHFLLQCIKVKSESEVAQSCPTLRDPMDCSLPGSSVHGIFRARVLEWGAIAFSDITSSWLIYFITGGLYPLNSLTCFSQQFLPAFLWTTTCLFSIPISLSLFCFLCFRSHI